MLVSTWDFSVTAKFAGPPSRTHNCVAVIDKYVVGTTLENAKYSKKMLFQWPIDHRS